MCMTGKKEISSQAPRKRLKKLTKSLTTWPGDETRRSDTFLNGSEKGYVTDVQTSSQNMNFIKVKAMKDCSAPRVTKSSGR